MASSNLLSEKLPMNLRLLKNFTADGFNSYDSGCPIFRLFLGRDSRLNFLGLLLLPNLPLCSSLPFLCSSLPFLCSSLPFLCSSFPFLCSSFTFLVKL